MSSPPTESRSAPPRRFARLLEVGRDPLVAAAWPDRTVFVSTGVPLRPGPPPPAPPPASGWRGVLGLLRREFDAVILPAVHADWAHDERRTKRWGRRALSRLAAMPTAATWLVRLAGLTRRPVAVLDVADHARVSRTTLQLYPGHARHFKFNLTAADAVAWAGRVQTLPMTLNLAAYPAPLPSANRDTDVFFGAELNSPARRAFASRLDALRAAGMRVDQPPGRLPFDEYLARMARARLTLSPDGFGHECWRHYEALLVGSVPVLSAPPEPRCRSLEPGRSALECAADASDLIAVVRTALAEPSRLAALAAAGGRVVRERHAVRPAAARILASLGGE